MSYPLHRVFDRSMCKLVVVCISHSAPPRNEPESLCTSRLLSALVQKGARVHLITSDGPPTLPDDIAEEVFDKRIHVTRVCDKPQRSRLAYVFPYRTFDESARWIGPAVSMARQILKQYEDPILMTRSMPISSNFAGYYCRDLAKAWVAHFSDPYPMNDWRTHWYSRLGKPLDLGWAHRILRRADLVTVTCPNAIRYIEEKTGFGFRQKAMVLTHLALPKLQRGPFRLDRSQDEFIVAHIGNLMAERRADLLLQGAILAMEKHPSIRFLQYGTIAPEILQLCRKSRAFQQLDIRHVDNLSPRDATDLREQVDVNVIVDMDLRLPYSPFIPSKFPHGVCSGKPLLMISAEDSQMAAYTKKYCGGIFVAYSTPEAVANAICVLYDRWRGNDEFKMPIEYMQEFGPDNLVDPFIERLIGLSR